MSAFRFQDLATRLPDTRNLTPETYNIETERFDMEKALNFTVLGSGHGGRAVCGQIAEKGYPVVMYEPLEETADYLKIKAEKEMFLDGDITAGGKLSGATMNIEEAVKDTDVILVIVPSFAHNPIFEKYVDFKSMLDFFSRGGVPVLRRPRRNPKSLRLAARP